MDFLLSHWHCVLPIAAVLIGLFLLNRNKSKGNDSTESHTATPRDIQDYGEEKDNA